MNELLQDTDEKETDRRRAKSDASNLALYRRLSGAIAENRLPPGMKLGEESLADFFNVSRSRIREVLRDLARARLVTIQPNRGAFVAKPSIEETRQICQARRIIEGAMIFLVVEQITETQIDELHAKIVEEEQAWAHDDPQHAVRCSLEFHLRLVQFGGNQVISNTLESILWRGSLAAGIYGARHNPGCLCADHFAIVSALRARDAQHAHTLLIDHLDQIENRMRLKKRPAIVSIEDALRDHKL